MRINPIFVMSKGNNNNLKLKTMTKEEVYKLATVENQIINDNGNRIEFANGDVYAKQSITNLYRKVKVYF